MLDETPDERRERMIRTHNEIVANFDVENAKRGEIITLEDILSEDELSRVGEMETRDIIQSLYHGKYHSDEEI